METDKTTDGINAVAPSAPETSQASVQPSNESQFRSLIDSINLSVIIADGVGRIEYFNEAAEKLFGYSGAEIIGQPFEILITERNRERSRQEIGVAKRRNRDGNSQDSLVLAARRRDGTEFIAEISVGLQSQSTDSGFSVVLRDITRWQEAEQHMTALLMQEEKARDESEALRRASVLLSHNLKFEGVLNAILDSLGRLLPFDRATLLTLKDEYHLVLQSCRGDDSGDARAEGISEAQVFDIREDNLVLRIVRDRESVVISDAETDSAPRAVWISQRAQSWAAVPLIVGDKVIGICSIEKMEPGFFTPDHIRRAESLVAQAAIAIQNAHLFDQVERYSVQLEEKVNEHHRSKELLAEANGKLSNSLAELERRNHEVSRLSELTDLLQACQAPDEVFHVFEAYCPKVLIGREGALYMIDSSKLAVEGVAGWAVSGSFEPVFAPEACWALRRSRPHSADLADVKLRCPHLKNLHAARTLCVPIMAHGEALGVLSLFQASEMEGLSLERVASETRVASAMAEQIGLSLPNLKLREKLKTQSVRDPLTGMFNRRHMEESVARELLRVTRKKAPMGVMMIDIDHFKRFNDTYGHDAGDTLICEVGKVLQSKVRGEDIVARYGGEEFTVIMPEASREMTLQRAEALCQHIREIDLQHRGQPLGKISISVGVAMLPEDGQTPEDLLRAADSALYQAKLSGRNRVVISGAAAVDPATSARVSVR